NHTVGFHESSNVNTLEFPYGICNMSECGCQRFQGQILDGLRCIYCDHYEGFHSDWRTPNNPNNNINPITLLSSNNFHSNIIQTTTNSTAQTASTVPSLPAASTVPTVPTISNRYTNPRAEVIANLRPVQTIPLYSFQSQHTHTTRR